MKLIATAIATTLSFSPVSISRFADDYTYLFQREMAAQPTQTMINHALSVGRTYCRSKRSRGQEAATSEVFESIAVVANKDKAREQLLLKTVLPAIVSANRNLCP